MGVGVRGTARGSSRTELRSRVNVEVAVLGPPVPNSPYGLCRNNIEEEEEACSELRSCVKVEVAFLGSPSLIVLGVTMDVKQHSN